MKPQTFEHFQNKVEQTLMFCPQNFRHNLEPPVASLEHRSRCRQGHDVFLGLPPNGVM